MLKTEEKMKSIFITKRYFFIAVIAVLFGGLIFGCSKKAGMSEIKDNEVVASINQYDLTAGDFKDELKNALSSGMPQESSLKMKGVLLGEIITKKLLLQEAQKENFDKDPAFMKEIEKYWEQALLKLLVKKKMKDIGDSLVKKGELPGSDAYNSDMHETLEKWISGLKSNAKIKINQKVLEEIKEK